jgi:hypothetical protein
MSFLLRDRGPSPEVATTPAEWMPWNYRETLEPTVPLSDSA